MEAAESEDEIKMILPPSDDLFQRLEGRARGVVADELGM